MIYNPKLLPSSSARRRPTQYGLTLIELMVSLVIGLVLSIVASSTYLYSKQAYNAVSENSQMEENGRSALLLLARNIQTSGYQTLVESGVPPKPGGDSGDRIKGCDFGMVSPQNASSGADLACNSSAPAGSSPSASIAVFYDTDAYTSSGAQFQGFNCLGQSAALDPTNGKYLVRSYFFISTSSVQTTYGTTTMGQLSCVTESNSLGNFQAQPLIPGVHQMAITYLLPSGLDPTVSQKETSAAILEASNTWKTVSAVEICVLTKSIQPSGNDTQTQVTDCYGNAFTPSPGQSYRRFSTSVNLRNRI